MMWKQIDGYMWPYRINEDGEVQKFYKDKWVELHPYVSGGRARAMVKMRSVDNKKIEVPVVWLMADAFMGGRREGYGIIHKDGMKLNNALWNLEFRPVSKCGLMSCHSRKKTVFKIDKSGQVVAMYRSVAEAAKKEFVDKNCILYRCHNRIKHPYRLTGYNYQYESLDGRKKAGRKKKVEECESQDT